MSTTLRDPDTGRLITVPEGVAQSYVSQGWVRPGASTPAEPGLDSLTIPMLRDFAGENGVELAGLKRKPEIIAAIEKAVGPAA